MSKKDTALAAALIAIWGICWPVYKSGLQFAPPFLYLGLRLFLGGVILIIFLLPRRHLLRLKSNKRFYTISTLLNVVLTMGLQTIGLVYLPGGLISILVYIQPILVSILAWLWLDERMSKLKIASLMLGFIGIAFVSIDSIMLNFSLVAVIVSLFSALFWAIGVVYVKKVGTRADGFWMVAIQSFIGGLVLLLFSLFTENWGTVTPGPRLIGTIVWGSTFGIPVAFIIYYYLNQNKDISKVGAYTFLVPIIAVILGNIFLDEPFTINIGIGLLLVGVSIFLINKEPTFAMDKSETIRGRV